MLRAILGNKSGRISIGRESISVREVYKGREDMLTAEQWVKELEFLPSSYREGEIYFL